MDRFFFLAGSVIAFLAVSLGAFGAHALRERLTQDQLNIFEIATRYQMYHALALFAVAWASHRWPEANLQFTGWSFLVGIVIFSGSLYLLSLTGWRWLGALTPLGGLCLLTGWLSLVVQVYRQSSSSI